MNSCEPAQAHGWAAGPVRPARDRELLGVLGLGIALPLLFAAYTGHTWEDWYITFRASKNLALGNGLVFTLGERVHSFTSPIGTLVPALLSYLTGNTDDDLVIWLFRIIGALLHGAAAVLLLRIARSIGMPGWVRTLLLGLFIFDGKTIDFSINGMETAFLIFFLVLTLRVHLVPSRRPGVLFGLAWAGLMWTRPDGFVLIGSLCAGFLVFRPGWNANWPRRRMLREYGIGLAICSSLYAPWLIWAWSYYGSFVPHTVTAKGLSADGANRAAQILVSALGMFGFNSGFDDVFTPSYGRLGGWPTGMAVVSRVAAMVSAFAWVMSQVRRDTRALSLAFLGVCLYLQFIKIRYPWYVPPATTIASLVVSLLAWQFVAAIGRWGERFRARLLIAFSLPAVVLGITCASAYQLKYQQALIEDGNRRQIGLWLKANARPADRVFLEPLGYIGFFSQLKMLDVPGLASPEVVAARRELHTDSFGPLIDRLQPEWLVLRPVEVGKVDQVRPAILQKDYKAVRSFDVSAQVSAVPFLPGRDYLRYDQTFIVFHRQPISVSANDRRVQ